MNEARQRATGAAKGYLVGIHHGRAATNAEGASTAGVAQDAVTLLRLLNVK